MEKILAGTTVTELAVTGAMPIAAMVMGASVVEDFVTRVLFKGGSRYHRRASEMTVDGVL